MSEKYILKETAPFVQFSSVNITDEINPLFDIQALPDQTLEDYCQKLIDHVFNITHSQIPDFIAHHCGLVKDPLLWLNKFEKLISLNDELFKGSRNESRLVKLYTSIESKRNRLLELQSVAAVTKPANKYINAESEERYFSFHELKAKLHSLDSDSERILLLTQEKFIYQQSNIEFLNIHTPQFDEQCDREIKQIYELKKLKDDIEKEWTNGHSPASKKIKVYLNINQFVDIFFQLAQERAPDEKPCIEANTNELASLIVNNFVDKDGNPISPQTVSTILKPSREDKRPNTGKRIDLNKLL